MEESCKCCNTRFLVKFRTIQISMFEKEYKENSIYLSPQVDFFLTSHVSLFSDYVVRLKNVKQHRKMCHKGNNHERKGK